MRIRHFAIPGIYINGNFIVEQSNIKNAINNRQTTYLELICKYMENKQYHNNDIKKLKDHEWTNIFILDLHMIVDVIAFIIYDKTIYIMEFF